MKGIVKRPKPIERTVGDLEPGALFLANGQSSRDWSRRAVFLRLYPHTRFEDLRKYQSTRRDCVCVNTGTGKITSFDPGYPVIELQSDNVQLEAKVDSSALSYPGQEFGTDMTGVWPQADARGEKPIAVYVGREQAVTFDDMIEALTETLETEFDYRVRSMLNRFIAKLKEKRTQS